MDLLKLKQDVHKYMNKINARRRPKRRDIKSPASLTEEEIQDAVRCCRIRAKLTSGIVLLWRKKRKTKSVSEPPNKR